MTILGIDEAGRGPLLGPLVMAGVKVKSDSKLIELGVKDSKLLTKEKRNELFDKIKEISDYEILIIQPKEIDFALNSEFTNLNWLEADNSIKIINKLNPKTAILDCPSTNVLAYTDYVKEKIDPNIKLIVEHKADLNYPVAGAASILAKVTRDREIENIKKELNINIGSGYPSDPYTQRFLKENYNKYPDIFRKTWESYKKIVKDQDQSKLFDF